LENLEEINKFIDLHDVPKSNQENIQNLNISIISNDIEDVIKILPTNKNSRSGGFMQNFTRRRIRGLLFRVGGSVSEH
jgi:hypothetical protein